MRRLFCLLIVVVCLLSGCGNKEEASFFYRRGAFQYGTEDGVIVSEVRDVTGHATNLPFLISLYLMGPLDKNYVSPFPSDVKLLYVSLMDDNLTVSLTDSSAMSESEYILASTCMALTCIEITNAKTVTVTSADRSVVIDPELLTLYDSMIPTKSTTGGEQ